jgi:protein required for attachment to host cells
MGKQRTWIAVLDHQRLHVYRTEPPGWSLMAEPGFSREERLPRSSELGSDRPGRSFDSLGGQRHAMEPHSDPQAVEGRRFVAGIADDLLRARREKLYERLVLVAPPRALGELRPLLHHEVAAVIAAELAHDFTRTPLKELESLLARHELLPPQPKT